METLNNGFCYSLQVSCYELKRKKNKHAEKIEYIMDRCASKSSVSTTNSVIKKLLYLKLVVRNIASTFGILVYLLTASMKRLC